MTRYITSYNSFSCTRFALRANPVGISSTEVLNQGLKKTSFFFEFRTSFFIVFPASFFSYLIYYYYCRQATKEHKNITLTLTTPKSPHHTNLPSAINIHQQMKETPLKPIFHSKRFLSDFHRDQILTEFRSSNFRRSDSSDFRRSDFRPIFQQNY